ncbi:cytochrome P450 2K6-like [Urocitellus parryii]
MWSSGELAQVHTLDFFKGLVKLSQKYGSIYSIQMGPKKVVVLSGYETVKEALIGCGNQFGERSQVPIFERIFNGKGIVFSHGETWKIMRRFSLTTLRNFGMGKQIIEDIIIEECQHLIQNLEAHRGNPFEITIVMNASVANIIVSVLFGKRFEYQDPQFLRLLTLIGENVKLVGSPRITLFNMFPVLGFLLRSHKTVLKNRDELFSFIRKTFHDHRRKFDKNDPRSFIDAFLVRQQEEKDASADYFSDENLVALVSNLFAAGTETTVSTLRWGILLMMRYPEVQKKVCDEITKVVGLAQPRIAHRTQMPYTDAVIHEVQRFANILPTSLPHATTTNVTFKNYYIPKVFMAVTKIPNKKNLVEERFFLAQSLRGSVDGQPTPWLWAQDKAEHYRRRAGLRSASGLMVARKQREGSNRKCVGESLARMELFLFFTSLMQKFTFQPPHGVSHLDLDLTPDIGFTTRPMPHKICALLRV